MAMLPAPPTPVTAGARVGVAVDARDFSPVILVAGPGLQPLSLSGARVVEAAGGYSYRAADPCHIACKGWSGLGCKGFVPCHLRIGALSLQLLSQFVQGL